MERNRGIILLVGAIALACLFLVEETSETSSLTTSATTSETLALTTSVSTTSDSLSASEIQDYNREDLAAALDPLLRPSVVRGWGDNIAGQIGNGDPQVRSSIAPVKLAGIADAKAITAGRLHTVILKADGAVWTTGSNGAGQLGRPWGQLGDGTRVTRPWPVPSLDVDWITFLAACNHQTIVAR